MRMCDDDEMTAGLVVVGILAIIAIGYFLYFDVIGDSHGATLLIGALAAVAWLCFVFAANPKLGIAMVASVAVVGGLATIVRKK